jgi:hypothetical protein
VNRICTFLLLFATLGGSLWAQETQETQEVQQTQGTQENQAAGTDQEDRMLVRPQVDWQGGVLILEVAMPIDPVEFGPGSRYGVERDIERLLPGLFMSSVVEIPFDSYRTIGERLKEDPLLFQRVERTAISSVSKRYSRVQEDLQEIQVLYRFPFYGEGGFVVPLIFHKRPFPLEGKLGFVPSRNFTGLVIYASGELPAHGKDIRQPVQPALFPTLYDEDMNEILSVQMCDPDFLKRWGMVAYSDSEEDSALLERIGAAPLRTVARGVFGINATDLLLPNEAVDRLLVREANREMLSQGRVLIVIDSLGKSAGEASDRSAGGSASSSAED